MNLFHSRIDTSDYIQSIPDTLIHEISKEPKPFEYEQINKKMALKYKNPDVRKNNY